MDTPVDTEPESSLAERVSALEAVVMSHHARLESHDADLTAFQERYMTDSQAIMETLHAITEALKRLDQRSGGSGAGADTEVPGEA